MKKENKKKKLLKNPKENKTDAVNVIFFAKVQCTQGRSTSLDAHKDWYLSQF